MPRKGEKELVGDFRNNGRESRRAIRKRSGAISPETYPPNCVFIAGSVGLCGTRLLRLFSKRSAYSITLVSQGSRPATRDGQDEIAPAFWLWSHGFGNPCRRLKYRASGA